MKTIQDLDQDDESLVRYKQQLLGQTTGVKGQDGSNTVIVFKTVYCPTFQTCDLHVKAVCACLCVCVCVCVCTTIQCSLPVLGMFIIAQIWLCCNDPTILYRIPYQSNIPQISLCYVRSVYLHSKKRYRNVNCLPLVKNNIVGEIVIATCCDYSIPLSITGV